MPALVAIAGEVIVGDAESMPELPDAVELALVWPAEDLSPFIRHFVAVTREVAAEGRRP